MKIKDISVGDCVQALQVNYEPYSVEMYRFRVNRVFGDCGVLYCDNGGILFTEESEWNGKRSYDMVEPIPLSEEILLKNGFVFKGGYYTLKGKDTIVSVHKDMCEMEYAKVTGMDTEDEETEYASVHQSNRRLAVHELQHFLRMNDHILADTIIV